MSARESFKAPTHHCYTIGGPTVFITYPDGHMELGEGFTWEDVAKLLLDSYYAALDHQEKMREDFFDSCEKIIKSLSGR